MNKVLKSLVLTAAAFAVLQSAHALTISATISTATVNTPGAALLLNVNESLTYALTGTATGTILIEKSFNARDWRPAGVSVSGTGSVSSTGKLYSNDKRTFFRWRASTMTAGTDGSFVTTLYDNDDVVQEFSNNKNVPIVIITDDGMAVSGTLQASSATLTATTLPSPVFTGAVTVPAGSTFTIGGSFAGVNGSTAIAAGSIGYVVSTITASLAIPSTGSYTDVAAIGLSTGVWDVSAKLVFSQGASVYEAPSDASFQVIVNTVPTATTGALIGYNYDLVSPSTTSWTRASLTIPPFEAALTANATYYLKIYPGTPSTSGTVYRGSLRARRMR